MQTLKIEENVVLCGHDRRTRIVAVEPAGRFVRLFFRAAEGVYFHDEPFRPFILIEEPALISGCRVPCAIRSLEGQGLFRYQLQFDCWADCISARDYLLMHGGDRAAERFQFVADLAYQYLVSTGTTLFKGMEFAELRCMCLDIETYCTPGFSFSNPEREDDRITSIACRDNHGMETVLRGNVLAEADMLTELGRIIRERDPDVLVGHNIFRFDLEYIRKRAALNGVRLNWGRNGGEPHVVANSRWNIAEKVIDYPRWDIYGRHIIDTYFLALHYDISQRSLQSLGLKQVAAHFGVAAKDRVYLAGSGLSQQFEQDPEMLYRYNQDDVIETEALFHILAYPWFLQTRMFPYSLQNCPLRGNATRINALFIREYLRQGRAIPARTAESAPFEGGYTELFCSGLKKPVVHCDVASLYPSLMLAYCIRPCRDELGLFLPMLAGLRSFRLQAKQAARECVDMGQRQYYDALQQVFKVLINSFFGYLGASGHNFSDPAAAAEVTRLGRVTIKHMIELLRRQGAEPVEVDTDGVYFVPPAGCEQETQQRDLVQAVSDALPAGIDVEMDGRYRVMFAYKVKNYALLDDEGRILIRGSSLKSRGMEPYLREFLQRGIELLLTASGQGLDGLYGEYANRLRSRKFEIAWVARTETLKESPENYQAKVRSAKRNRSAAFETALRSGRRFRAGDQISYYITGNEKDVTAYENSKEATAFDPAHVDVNVAYYVEKLRLLNKRFAPFLPKEPTLFD